MPTTVTVTGAAGQIGYAILFRIASGQMLGPDEKIDRDPWLKRLFAGYAFAIDYRDRRGHAHMLADQEQTKRVTTRPQPGKIPLRCRVPL